MFAVLSALAPAQPPGTATTFGPRPRKFGLGIFSPDDPDAGISLVGSWSNRKFRFDLTENPDWALEPESANQYRYQLLTYRHGRLIEQRGFDLSADAELASRIRAEGGVC